VKEKEKTEMRFFTFGKIHLPTLPLEPWKEEEEDARGAPRRNQNIFLRGVNLNGRPRIILVNWLCSSGALRAGHVSSFIGVM